MIQINLNKKVTQKRKQSVVAQRRDLPKPVTLAGEHVPKKTVDCNTVNKQRQSVASDIFTMVTAVFLMAS